MTKRKSYTYPPDVQFGSSAKGRQEEVDRAAEGEANEADEAAVSKQSESPRSSHPRAGNKATPAGESQ